MRLSVCAGLTVLGCFCLSTSPVSAYTIHSAITTGCHERITMTALGALRAEEKFAIVAREVPLSGDLKLASEDPPFDTGGERSETAALSLLFAVRDPDLGGRGSMELDALAYVHGDPDDQQEHCLRASDEDEPNGTQLALDKCREHLLKTFNEALDGLGADGAPDLNRREDLQIALGVRGQVDVAIPVFYLRMGKLLHGVQDSFTHLLRAQPDNIQVVSTLNWIDWVNDEFVESRDGHEHLAAMDNCEDDHPLLTLRRTLAETASTEMLKAAYDPDLSREQKLARAQEIIDQYLTYKADSGCTADNRWCDAPELDVPEKTTCICQAPGAGASAGGAGGVGLAAAGLAARAARRRAGRRERRQGETARREAARREERGSGRGGAKRADGPSWWRRALTALGLAAMVAAWPSSAQAEEEAKLDTGVKAPEVKAVNGFLFYGALGLSFDKPALAPTIAGRYRINPSWMVGLDAEWNPFYNTYVGKFQRGVFNGYATVIRQFPLKYEEINLRITANVGTSILLQDLVGAPAGKPGIFLGLAPLGVEWRLSKGTHLVIDPLSVAFPVPQLSGVPYGYRQYRFTIGLEFG